MAFETVLKDLKCIHCKKPVNLRKVVRIADAMSRRDLVCPHCGEPIGKSN